MADGFARRDILPSLGKPLLLIAGLVAAGVLLRRLPMHDFAAQAGQLGDLGFLVIAAAACAVGVPRQVVAFAGGYAHGPWLGGALALAAQLLGCAIDLLWARLVAGSWVRRRIAGRFGPRLARLNTVLATHPFKATLTLRLLPVGNNLALNLLAGGFGVSSAAFLAASAIGYLPQTAVFVLLGTGVHVARATELALAVVLLAISTGLGLYLLRDARRTA